MPSTVIRAFDYRPRECELEILFVTGRRYVYHGVPQEAFDSFRTAFAKGRAFNAHIRGRYSFTDRSSDPSG